MTSRVLEMLSTGIFLLVSTDNKIYITGYNLQLPEYNQWILNSLSEGDGYVWILNS